MVSPPDLTPSGRPTARAVAAARAALEEVGLPYDDGGGRGGGGMSGGRAVDARVLNAALGLPPPMADDERQGGLHMLYF